MRLPRVHPIAALTVVLVAVLAFAVGRATAQEPSSTSTAASTADASTASSSATYRPPTVNPDPVVVMAEIALRFRWVQADSLNKIAEAGERTAATAVVASPVSASSGGGSTGCDGHVVPGYILQRESGCSYDAYNPTGCGGSGCIGLYQLDAKHYNSTCAGLDTSPAGQDECASRLSNGGTNLAPWAATR